MYIRLYDFFLFHMTGITNISKPSFPGYCVTEDTPSLFHPTSTSTDLRAAGVNLQSASSTDFRGGSYTDSMDASIFQTKEVRVYPIL